MPPHRPSSYLARTRRRLRVRSTSFTEVAVWSGAAAGAAGAFYAECQPTGTDVIDAAFRIAVGAIVPLASSRAKRAYWYPLVILATLFGAGWPQLLALLAVPLLVVAALQSKRSRPLGAVIGALTIQSLLRLPDLGFLGASALVAAVAIVPCLVGGYQMARRRTQKRVRTAAAVGGGAVALALAVAGLTTYFVQRDLQRAIAKSDTALESVSNGDTDQAAADFDRSAELFMRAGGRVNARYMVPARFIPLLAQNLETVGTAADTGALLAGNGQATAASADYDDLRYESGQFDLDRINEVIPALSQSAQTLTVARKDLSKPRTVWLAGPVDERLDEFEVRVRSAERDADFATRVALFAPTLLGGNGTRRYFVAFVTPAELRGSGGFIGSYGELTAEAGRLRLTRSGPIRELIEAAPSGARTISGPKDYLTRYGRFRPADFFQDVTLSPDFPATAQVIGQLYPQSGGQKVDGVLQVDPIALAALLRFTGPIEVAGLPDPLTPDNAAEVLLRDQYRIFDQRNSDQEDTLAEATRLTFERLTTGDLPGPRSVSRILGPIVREGHIKIHYFKDPGFREILGEIGADGVLSRPLSQDVLSIVSQNAGNNKIDAYLRREVDLKATVDAKGTYSGKLRITLRNDAPATGLPDIVIGNERGDPRGTNRLRLSVYTRHAVGPATVAGSPVVPESQKEAGLNAHTVVVLVPPESTVVVEMDLRGLVAFPYDLQLVPQPLINPDRVAVEVDGPGGPLATRRSAPLLVPESRRSPQG